MQDPKELAMDVRKKHFQFGFDKDLIQSENQSQFTRKLNADYSYTPAVNKNQMSTLSLVQDENQNNYQTTQQSSYKQMLTPQLYNQKQDSVQLQKTHFKLGDEQQRLGPWSHDQYDWKQNQDTKQVQNQRKQILNNFPTFNQSLDYISSYNMFTQDLKKKDDNIFRVQKDKKQIQDFIEKSHIKQGFPQKNIYESVSQQYFKNVKGELRNKNEHTSSCTNVVLGIDKDDLQTNSQYDYKPFFAQLDKKTLQESSKFINSEHFNIGTDKDTEFIPESKKINTIQKNRVKAQSQDHLKLSTVYLQDGQDSKGQQSEYVRIYGQKPQIITKQQLARTSVDESQSSVFQDVKHQDQFLSENRLNYNDYFKDQKINVQGPIKNQRIHYYKLGDENIDYVTNRLKPVQLNSGHSKNREHYKIIQKNSISNHFKLGSDLLTYQTTHKNDLVTLTPYKNNLPPERKQFLKKHHHTDNNEKNDYISVKNFHYRDFNQNKLQ